jgi:hypothetical protein
VQDRDEVTVTAAVVTIWNSNRPKASSATSAFWPIASSPLHGGPAETYELEFHSDQDGPLPEPKEEGSSRGRVPARSRHRIPEAGETAMSDGEAQENYDGDILIHIR